MLRRKWNGILYEGRYDDFSVNTNLTNNDNPKREISRRAANAFLLATNPDTFELMVNNKINLFHGTNANALSGILKYGMNSLSELAKKGIEATTGEKWSRIGEKRDFISFTDDIDTAISYSTITALNESQESFGMLIGISTDDMEKLKPCSVYSNIPEIGIRDNIPLECIKMIAVPSDKVDFVKKMVDDKEILVSSIDTSDKFYYIDDMSIEFNLEMLKNLKEPSKKRLEFKYDDIKEEIEKRRAFGIKDIYTKIKEKINSRGKENEQCK